MPRAKLPILEEIPKHSRVDEVIWGHRMRQDQTGWLLVLEMLNVANACLEATNMQNPLPDMGKPDAPCVSASYRVRFRNLLFSFNQKAAELAAAIEQERMTSDEAWDAWLLHTTEQYAAPGGCDFTPLRGRFDDFLQFERAIDLVRATAVNGLESKKGTYSRYLFPMSADSLFWEMALKNNGGSQVIDSTYNSFTRAGTLLHIMLSRSSMVDAIRRPIADFVLRDSQAATLVKHLQVDEMPTQRRSSMSTYLPYEKHSRFDRLGEDYFNILSLKVPQNDKLLWLVPLSALHLSLYHAEVAHEEYLGGHLPLPVVCEILAPKTTTVRQQSIDSLNTNGDLSRRAVENLLDAAFSSEEWLNAATNASSMEERFKMAKEYIAKQLFPPKKVLDEIPCSSDVDVLRIEVKRFFQERHQREFAGVHAAYGKQAGLVSRRGTNRNRYAPTDQLLKSLVLANVSQEIQLEEFLDRLFTRYGLVLGCRQQEAILAAGYPDLSRHVSGIAFRNNQTRLESRLKSMGMLRKLSDSQAYVINPFI